MHAEKHKGIRTRWKVRKHMQMCALARGIVCKGTKKYVTAGNDARRHAEARGSVQRRGKGKAKCGAVGGCTRKHAESRRAARNHVIAAQKDK